MTIALIDGDTFAYRCAAACREDDLDYAKLTIDEMIQGNMERVDAKDMMIFLTPRGRENVYRHYLNPYYKAGRPEPPAHLMPLREHLVAEWGAITGNFCEADDLLGIYTTADTITIANDKDALTVPGIVYNFVKGQFHQISYRDAKFNFYYQMLVGDSADNIKGARGIGKKKAPRILNELTVDEMDEAVRMLYDDEAQFIINYNLLRIWTKQWLLFDGTMDKQYQTYEEFFAALQELKKELGACTNEEQNDLLENEVSLKTNLPLS